MVPDTINPGISVTFSAMITNNYSIRLNVVAPETFTHLMLTTNDIVCINGSNSGGNPNDRLPACFTTSSSYIGIQSGDYATMLTLAYKTTKIQTPIAPSVHMSSI